jgi:phage terminase large subunit-like protein
MTLQEQGQQKAGKVKKFIANLKHTKGKWSGVAFDLLPWEDEIIDDVFGTLKKGGLRKYNTAYVEVPKKNGKSEIAAAIALYMLCADGEQSAEVYGCASDRGQASLVFDVAVDMVDQQPDLRKVIKPILSVKRLVYLPTRSFYHVCSSESFSKHGLNVHCCIFDELHAQPNRSLYDVMTKESGAAREQPLNFVITTAGDDPDRTSIGWEIHQKSLDVLNGVKKIPNWYAKIYGVPDDADWTDEANWIKANPSVGHNLSLEMFRAAFIEAQQSEADERFFRQMRLNQWVKTRAAKWISQEVWDQNAGLVVPERLKGRKCYGGLDLSSKRDITAFVLVFPPTDDDDKYTILPHMWIPEENMRERVQKDRVAYDEWASHGFIHVTPGNVIDYRFIQSEITRLRDEFEILEIGYDPWNAQQTATELTDAGLEMVEVRQGYKSMSPPMREMEALLYAGRFNTGTDPVMRWMFGNLEVRIDENDNIRPIKGKSTERIDGIVALINAMNRVIVAEDKTSVYEERGLITL